MPPRLLATSLSRLLACGCSSPWAASAGAPPPPQKTYGQVDRASEMSPGRLRATAHIYGIGCCSPPRQPPTHLQPVDSQSVTLPLSWCSSTPQTFVYRTARYCCMMMPSLSPLRHHQHHHHHPCRMTAMHYAITTTSARIDICYCTPTTHAERPQCTTATITTSARTDMCNCAPSTFCHAHTFHGIVATHLHLNASFPHMAPPSHLPLPINSIRTKRPSSKQPSSPSSSPSFVCLHWHVMHQHHHCLLLHLHHCLPTLLPAACYAIMVHPSLVSTLLVVRISSPSSATRISKCDAKNARNRVRHSGLMLYLLLASRGFIHHQNQSPSTGLSTSCGPCLSLLRFESLY